MAKFTTVKNGKDEKNILFHIDKADYIDVVWNDYGEQVRIKGVIDGESNRQIFFSPSWKAGRALVESGVIAVPKGFRFAGKDDENPKWEQGEGPVIKVLVREFGITRKKTGDDEYESIVISGVSEAADDDGDPGPEEPGEEADPYEAPKPLPKKAATAARTVVVPPKTKTTTVAGKGDKMAEMFQTYNACLVYANGKVPQVVEGATTDNVMSAAATLFIGASKL